MVIDSRASHVRTPRVRAQINGVVVDSVVQMSVTLNGSRKSSRFELTIGVGRNKSNSAWLYSSSGMTTVTILMRFQPRGSETTIFEGLSDQISYDPINQLARIEGRDYSSVLINSSYQDSYCNQTASEIANRIAARHGFNASITPTSTMVGSYQSSNYNQVVLNAHSQITSEWDLLSHLAIVEGFELFVSDTTLVFAPLAAIRTNYVTVKPGDVKSIRFFKNCPLSNQTRLIVKSWNSWLNQTLSYSDDQTHNELPPDSTGLSCDPGTEITIIKPNLTSQGTEQWAQNYSNALNERTLSVNIVLPGEVSLRPFDILVLSGNGPDFDANYIVRSVRRQYSSAAGFTDSVLGFVMTSNLTPEIGSTP